MGAGGNDSGGPPTVPLSRSASDLGGSESGSWRRSVGGYSPSGDAAVTPQVHDDASASSRGSLPEVPTVLSSAAWTGEGAGLPEVTQTASLVGSYTGGGHRSAGSSGHLDLSSHSSMTTLPPEAAGSRGGPPSSGTVSSLSSIPSDLPNLEPDTPEHSQAAPSASSNGAWSFWAHLDDQGTASTRPSTQRSGSMAPAGSVGSQDAPVRSRSEGEILLASNPASPSSDRPFREDLASRTQGAPSEPSSSPPAQTEGQGDGQATRARVESAYEAAERAVYFDFESHATFRSSYNELKNAMSEAGSMQTDRLAGLLGREEEEIRSHYGRTRWRSLNRELDVDPGWDAAKRSARNSQLQWIKDERASLRSLAPIDEGASSSAAAAPSRSRFSGVSRLSQWARSSLRPGSTRPDASQRPLAPISEDHAVEEFSDDDRAAEAHATEARAEPVATAATHSRRSGINRWAAKHLVPKSVRSRFGR